MLTSTADQIAGPAHGSTSRARHQAPGSRPVFAPSTGWLHVAAVLWTVVLAGVLLAPALSRGWMLGPYDLLAHQGLTVRPGVVLHGSYENSDLISQLMQWTSLNWTEVHHGVLPLWNPYNGLGLPLAFNWQAASFGIPSLVGYLVPLRFAFTAGIVTTLVIAGTGAYFLARVLRIGFLGSIMVATVFELGGPLIGWLGYPHGQVLAWGGWLLGAGVLVVRATRPIPAIALLAAVIACMVYSGQPETFVVMLAALVVFVIVLLGTRALAPHLGFEPGCIRKPATNLIVAMAAGLALGAPLLLPGVQLTDASVRSLSNTSAPVPFHDLSYLVFSSFDGVQVPGSVGFGSSFFYNEFAAYVGLIALVLAVVAAVTGILRRRPEVFATTAVVVVMGVVAFVAPLDRLLDRVPVIREIALIRALMPLSLALAVLAGFGLEEIVRSPRERVVRLSLLYGFAVSALLLLVLWLFGRGGAYKGLPHSALALASHARAESFIWPVASVAVGLAAAGLLWWRARLRVVAAIGLIVCEALFLLAAGSIQISSSPDGYPPTPAVAKLQHTVGTSVVATGSNEYCAFGLNSEANIGYQIHQINVYDPSVPQSYFTSWQRETGTGAGPESLNLYCPSVTTVEEARLLGAAYVLVPAGTPGPRGAMFVTELKVPRTKSLEETVLGVREPPPLGDISEDLYRVPGAAKATIVTMGSLHAALPPSGASGRPVPVDDSNPARLSLTTDAGAPSVLRLHLSDVPGWHATIDGQPLRLESLAGFMLQAHIPPGRHVIEVSYWPTSFTVGLLLALVAAVALAVALGVDIVGRARSRREPT